MEQLLSAVSEILDNMFKNPENYKIPKSVQEIDRLDKNLCTYSIKENGSGGFITDIGQTLNEYLNSFIFLNSL